MPGLRNPIQRMIGHVRRSTEQISGAAKAELGDGRRTTFDWMERPTMDAPNGFVDLAIHFIGASGLPKMDVIGTADPYFVAKLDSALTFV